jgi:hypothetical protein
LNDFLIGLHHGDDLGDQSSVVVVELNLVDIFEKLLEIVLDLVWVGTDRKDLKKIVWGYEVESCENTSLLLKIEIKSLLTEQETFLQNTELTLKDIVGAALDDFLLFVSSLHDLLPLLVNLLELLGFNGHLLSNFTTGEDCDKILPKGLHLEPLTFNDIEDFSQKLVLSSYDSLEWGDVSHCIHLVKSNDMSIEGLHNILDVSSEYARYIDVLVWENLEFGILPIGDNLVVELQLELQLLIS